ncbi:hypothetical protein [Streptacidiphilus melanogenes]|uniref:hypothetical protein n=1 Tax=Streptacidiphilus melanogenes TaxID=411235 RepID=UPI0005A8877B|nr:hypothetical protein [Streptacidiphilus melanogenes]
MSEPAATPTPNLIRVIPYPDQLHPTATTITCPRCAARRDWLLLETCGQVFMRCRCAHEWPEPRLAIDFFDDNFAYAEQGWNDFDRAMIALGFDGLLAGAVWA